MNKVLLIGYVAIVAHFVALATSAVLCYMYYTNIILEEGPNGTEDFGQLKTQILELECLGKKFRVVKEF